MTVDQELKIVESSKQNVQEFNKIYDEYFDKIYYFCLARLQNKEASEDVTSQVFLQAVESIHKFDTSKNIRFGAWLYRVAHSRIIDHFRKSKHNSYFDFENLQIEDKDSSRFESELQNEFLQTQIASVLKDLRGNYQQVISLKFFSDLSISEIAEVVNKKPTQVSVILHRALKSFKKIFEKKYPETEIFELD